MNENRKIKKENKKNKNIQKIIEKKDLNLIIPKETKNPKPIDENARPNHFKNLTEDSIKTKKEVKATKLNDSTFQQSSLRVPENIRLDNEKVQKKLARKLAKDNIPQRINIEKKIALFSHLPQYDKNIMSITKNLSFSTILNTHIIKLGLQYAQHKILGSNSRCLYLLEVLKKLIYEYQSVPQKEIQRDLESKLKPNIFFLSQCRPLSINMRNAIKYIKMQIAKIPPNFTEAQAKALLISSIDDYIMEKIVLAGEAISKTYAITKISNYDTILIYSYSTLVFKILYDCHKSNKKIHVLVVDSRPDLSGKIMLQKLLRNGIKCSYLFINNLSQVMPRVNKVILGAHALLANGYVMGRVGASLITLCAKLYNVPVLLCCETYKFAEKVQTDSFVYNELADPNSLLTAESPLKDWEKIDNLNLLNLTYDVTPPEFITMVITELGMLPCTSVPVILRVKHLE